MTVLSRVQDARTKDGRPIEFHYALDIEGDNNRGWQVDALTAFVENQPHGYIKVSYIPKSRFKRYYQSIFDYERLIAGKLHVPANPDHTHWQAWTDDDLRKLLAGYRREATLADYAGLANYELRALAAALEERLMLSGDFAAFKHQWLDKPVVDFIRVYNEADGEPNRRRNGVARALYLEAARWLGERDMMLYQGSSSPEAQAVWDKLREQKLAYWSTPRQRLCLNAIC
jgi:GNAT superfamily N-acetyltransferase